MSVIISVLKARLAFIAIVNAAVHIAALLGKGADMINPELLSQSYDSAMTTVIGVTGTLGLAFPSIKNYVQFVDVPMETK